MVGDPEKGFAGRIDRAQGATHARSRALWDMDERELFLVTDDHCWSTASRD
jgi:hypothetical protein